MRRRASLFSRTALSIGAGLIVFHLLAGIAVVAYVLMPLERRSADDFAALLVLSAETWAELPPQTRPAFVAELATNNKLDLSEAREPGSGETRHHYLYMSSLRAALARHADHGAAPRLSETEDGTFLADIPMASHLLRFSFRAERVVPQPWTPLALTIAAGLAVSVGLAWLLARRVSAPVARLAEAARQIGSGEHPAALPEPVERELGGLVRVFNETAAQLDAQRQNQATLLAGVSHDLRSPLARLQMALGVLGEEVDSPLIPRMEDDVRAMNELIGAQLRLARARQREDATATDVDALLRELSFVPAPDQAALSLRLEAPACSAVVAPIALRRIVANLIDNARRHAGQAPCQIVRRRCGGTILIGVRDRGPGIPAALRETVFRPFFRIEPSRSRATGGSGLGLAIARELAQAQGWRLAFKPRVGGGSSFWLAIPAARASDGPA